MRQPDIPGRLIIGLQLLLLLIMLAYKYQATTTLPGNQDEFNYLSQVYAHDAGTLLTPWQSFHVHFFKWLRVSGQNELEQILAARTVMFFFFLGTVSFLYLLAKQFLSVPASLFSVLCFLSMNYIIINGASFRADSPVVFLALAALWLFTSRGRSAVANVMAGSIMAASCLFTLKAGFYLILFAALSFTRFRPRIQRYRCFGLKMDAWFASGFAIGLCLFYWLHKITLHPTSGARFVARSYSDFISWTQLFPARRFFLTSLHEETLTWVILFTGLFLLIYDSFKKNNSETRPAFLLFAVPLLIPVVYRNCSPYFYVFLMPLPIMFCGYALDRISSLLKKVVPRYSVLLWGFVALAMCYIGINRTVYVRETGPKIAESQREFLNTIHRIFPRSVPYIDGCRMVASFPSAGFFMSSAVMRSYLGHGTRSVREAVVEKNPPFVLANVPQLDLDFTSSPPSDSGLALRNDDWRFLRSNFIHHWGPLWVAGKEFTLGKEELQERFEIVIEGFYTIETADAIIIDNVRRHPGEVIALAHGVHTISAIGENAKVTLRYGNHIYRPRQEPTGQDLFLGSFA